MRSSQHQIGAFQKVAECLYRYSSNGVYYARIKRDGKEMRRSLHTTDKTIAKRKLADFRDEQGCVDASSGKLTVDKLCERFLKTIQHQKPKTTERKTLIVKRIQEHLPCGRRTQVQKVKPSDLSLWLSRYKFGIPSRNLHIACAKELFAMAVNDNVISRSPAAHLRKTKLPDPIRRTPTFEQFNAIVESIRSQQFNGHDAEESADFTEFVGLAGLGQAEASALSWPDVDWQREQIITFRHKTKSGFAIPLYPQLRPLLERRYSQRTSDAERVFKISNAKKAIAAACKRLGLPAFSHRSFRRMFIVRAIERGVDVKVIAEWQGHRDGGTLILRTYSHVRPVHSRRMAKLMTTELPDNVVPMKGATA